ncbi:hypothetical protein Patl1_36962 [Pistacia atlantica]|nr:hypothetical protein Patl1_36962 [Pistacia atlantica]
MFEEDGKLPLLDMLLVLSQTLSRVSFALLRALLSSPLLLTNISSVCGMQGANIIRMFHQGSFTTLSNADNIYVKLQRRVEAIATKTKEVEDLRGEFEVEKSTHQSWLANLWGKNKCLKEALMEPRVRVSKLENEVARLDVERNPNVDFSFLLDHCMVESAKFKLKASDSVALTKEAVEGSVYTCVSRSWVSCQLNIVSGVGMMAIYPPLGYFLGLGISLILVCFAKIKRDFPWHLKIGSRLEKTLHRIIHNGVVGVGPSSKLKFWRCCSHGSLGS